MTIWLTRFGVLLRSSRVEAHPQGKGSVPLGWRVVTSERRHPQQRASLPRAPRFPGRRCHRHSHHPAGSVRGTQFCAVTAEFLAAPPGKALLALQFGIGIDHAYKDPITSS